MRARGVGYWLTFGLVALFATAPDAARAQQATDAGAAPAEAVPVASEEKKADPPPEEKKPEEKPAEKAEEKKTEEKKAEEKKAEPPPPPPPEEKKPAPPPPASKIKAVPQAKKPGGPWASFITENGQSSWTEPSGWILDEARSVPGLRMSWREPEGRGTFRIVAYARTTKIEDLVRAMSFGGKPKAMKAWMCAENQHGPDKIGVAARPTEEGDFLIVILQASPETWKKLGGLKGLRNAADGTSGFRSTLRRQPMPGD
jgi:hypothetical protein